MNVLLGSTVCNIIPTVLSIFNIWVLIHDKDVRVGKEDEKANDQDLKHVSNTVVIPPRVS